MHNNSLYRFHYCKDTYLYYKKMTSEYRLVWDVNFIIPCEVSQSVLLGCTRTDTLVNKFSNLSALVARTWVSSCWVSTWFTITSKNIYDNASQDAMYQIEELIAQVVRSFKAGTHEGACSRSTLLQHAPGAKLPRLHQRFLEKSKAPVSSSWMNVTFCFCFKRSLYAKHFTWKCINEPVGGSSMNGFPLTLVLSLRQKATHTWPIGWM